MKHARCHRKHIILLLSDQFSGQPPNNNRWRSKKVAAKARPRRRLPRPVSPSAAGAHPVKVGGVAAEAQRQVDEELQVVADEVTDALGVVGGAQVQRARRGDDLLRHRQRLPRPEVQVELRVGLARPSPPVLVAPACMRMCAGVSTVCVLYTKFSLHDRTTTDRCMHER